MALQFNTHMIRHINTYIFIFFLFVIVSFGNAQITFQKTYGNTNAEYGYAVDQTMDKGYVLVGYTSSYGAGSNDVYITKTDSMGSVSWSKIYGGTRDDEAYAVQQTFDGGYVIAGYSKSFGVVDYDMYLIRTDGQGDTLWTRTYGGIKDDYANTVQQTTDGGFILAGYTNSFVSGADSGNIYLIKTDAGGNIKWTSSLGGTKAISDGYSIKQTLDKGYILTGYTNGFSDPNGDAYLLKADSTGLVSWIKTYGSHGVDWGNSVKQTSDGGYIVAGSASFDSTTLLDIYLIKTNSIGDTLWTKTYGGKGYDYGQSVEETIDGGYVVAGYTNNCDTCNYNVCLLKTDGNGNITWTKTCGGAGDDEGNAVHQASDGTYVIAGITNSFGAGDYDMYLIKTDLNGNTCNQIPSTFLAQTPPTTQINPSIQPNTVNTRQNDVYTLSDTGTVSTDACQQMGIKLISGNTPLSMTVFPNPNAGAFMISIDPISEEKIAISVKNVLGEIVYSSSLSSSKEIDLNNLSNGTYLLQLQSRDKIYSRKIILAK